MSAVGGLRPLAWLALALGGQAAALALIDAGPRLHYQHYAAVLGSGGANPLALGVVAVQTAVVLAGLVGSRRRLAAWLGGALTPLQLAAAAAVFVATSAAVSESVPVFLAELGFATLIQAVSLGNALLFGLALPPELLRRLRDRARSALARSGRGLALGAALWVTAVSAVISFASYERHPHITDEVAYHHHARFLAAGRLDAPAPPVPAAFPLFMMQVDGERWYPVSAPGWPAILALGFLLGLPWLVNPVLAGINVLLAHRLLRRLYDRETAVWSILLLAVSPWFVLMAINFMTHTATLTLALGAALATIRARRRRSIGWALAAGVTAAAIGLIRPLDAVVVAALLGLWALGLGGARLRAAGLAAMALGGAASGAAVLGYNRLMTGSWTEFPVMVYLNELWGPNANRLGFGPDRGARWPLDPFPGHAPLDALVNGALNAFSINVELFGWATGSVVLATLAVFRRHPPRADRLMLAILAAVFTAHFFYFYGGGPDFGARYWFLMIVPLVALSVRGAGRLAERLSIREETGGVRLAAVLGALSLGAILLYVPWRATDKYHHFWGMRPDVRKLAATHDFTGDLVLVRGDDFPDWASAAVYNPVDLTSDETVYAWDRDPETRAALRAAYPGRRIRVIEGPSITGAGYRLVDESPAGRPVESP